APGGAVVGDRPLPQRDPAGAPDRRAGGGRALWGVAPGDARVVRSRPLHARSGRRGGGPRGGAAVIVLNGESRELPAPATLAAALAELDVAPDARGVAVAVDGEVIPRARWSELELGEGAQVEVLTAMQGG